jgi:DNA-directed RNA polymerase subunit omega
MIHPPLNTLMEKVDSKYTLVVEVAKRARQLVGGKKPMVHADPSKPVSTAIAEVHQGLITYKRTREGIK